MTTKNVKNSKINVDASTDYTSVISGTKSSNNDAALKELEIAFAEAKSIKNGTLKGLTLEEILLENNTL